MRAFKKLFPILSCEHRYVTMKLYSKLYMKTFLFTLFITLPVFLLEQGIEISILNDRFSFVFPVATEIVPNQSNVVPEDPTVNHVTIIAHANGNNTLFFFAEELFEKSPAELEKRLQEDSILDKDETKILSNWEKTVQVGGSSPSQKLFNTNILFLQL